MRTKDKLAVRLGVTDEDYEFLSTLSAYSQSEGWFIATAIRDTEEYEIQHDSESGVFTDDSDVVLHIVERALKGSLIHNKTIDFIAKYGTDDERLHFIKSLVNIKEVKS